MGHNAFAAVGVPIVFSAPGGDILHALGSSARTAGTFTAGTVAAASFGKGDTDDAQKKNEELHFQTNLYEIDL
jgi:hypothetical protein